MNGVHAHTNGVHPTNPTEVVYSVSSKVKQNKSDCTSNEDVNWKLLKEELSQLIKDEIHTAKEEIIEVVTKEIRKYGVRNYR